MALGLALVGLSSSGGAASPGEVAGDLVRESRAEDPEERLAAAREVLLADLWDFAEWLRGRRLFATREPILQEILALDPDHGDARRALGFKRGRSGEWTPPKKPKTFHDYGDASDVPEHEARARDPYGAVVRALLSEGELSEELQDELERELLRVWPDDPALRAERGEVHTEHGWLLEETAASLERAPYLAERVRELIRTAEAPAPTKASEEEAALAEWTTVLELGDARFLGTVPREELVLIARQLQAVEALSKEIVNPNAHMPRLRVFAMTEAERDAFLDLYPYKRPGEDLAAIAAQVGTWFLPRNDVSYWTDARPYREDGIVRQAVSRVLGLSSNVTTAKPWLHEGLGLVLTELVTGTRLTWYMPGEDVEGFEGLRDRMLHESDWRALAAEVLRDPGRPPLAETLARSLEGSSSLDLLVSYALGLYLVEARADELPDLVDRLGHGARPEQAFEAGLGRTLEELDLRLVAWLVQRERLLGTGDGGMITAEATGGDEDEAVSASSRD